MNNNNNITYNGRINIAENLPDQNSFLMSDKIPVKSPIGYSDALKGNLENTQLSKEFFSAKNINTIQHGIIQEVYNLSQQKYKIDKQDEDQLKLIMRGVFLENSAHLPNQINEQIKELNNIIIQYCTPRIYTQILSYIGYINDVSSLAEPLERPKASTYKYKQNELKNFF